jgi:hypothetical protein
MEKKSNVNKILKEQEKERQRTLKRIERKSQQIQTLQLEQNSNKWQIEKQKIIEQCEKMKKTGKIDKRVLSKLGVELPDKKTLKQQLKNRRSSGGFGSPRNMNSKSQASLNKTQGFPGGNKNKNYQTVNKDSPFTKNQPKQDQMIKTSINNNEKSDSGISSKKEFKNQNKPMVNTSRASIKTNGPVKSSAPHSSNVKSNVKNSPYVNKKVQSKPVASRASMTERANP